MQATTFQRINMAPEVSGIDSESFVKPVKLLATMATDPLIVQLKHEADSKVLSVNVAGLRGTFDNAVISHAVCTAQAFTTACQLWPSRAAEPMPAPDCCTRDDFGREGKHLQGLHVLSIGIELAILDLGDKSTTFDTASKHQPRVCRLLLSGCSVKHKSDPEEGLQVLARDLSLLDLRALAPEYKAIVEQRATRPQSGSSHHALSLQKYVSGVHFAVLQLHGFGCFTEVEVGTTSMVDTLGVHHIGSNGLMGCLLPCYALLLASCGPN
jgi:hypothetical protein